MSFTYLVHAFTAHVLTVAKWNPLFAHLPIESLVYANQTGYYKAIADSTEVTDCAPFVEFMLDVIYETLVTPSSDSSLGNELGISLGKDLGKELFRNQKAIIRLLLDEPRITVKEMAKQLGVSTTTIENNLRTLREKNLVLRIGGRRAGYWQCQLNANQISALNTE